MTSQYILTNFVLLNLTVKLTNNNQIKTQKMSITNSPVRILPEKRVTSLHISERTKRLLDFIAKETLNIKDEVLYDALVGHLKALGETKGVKYNLEEILQ